MYQRDDKKYKLSPGPMAMETIQKASAPAPSAPQKGITEQFTDMAKTRLMTKGLDKGMAYGGEMLTKAMAPSAGATGASAATGAATGAGMGAMMSAAAPYAIPLLLATQFFSKGGRVGPLASVDYKSNGGKITANFYNSTKE